MSKILLSFVFALVTVISFNQTVFAAATSATKPYLSQTKRTVAWPTDVLVENYSGQTVTVRFITLVSDQTVSVDPYPATRYYAQLLDQFNVYQVRVMIWDYYGHLFYDQVVGSVKRVTLYPPSKTEKLSAKNVAIMK